MKLAKSVLVQKLGREYVAYDTEHSVMHELNETAYDLLRWLEKKTDEGELTKRLVEKYGISRKKAEEDVRESLRIFESKRLIVN